jgi:glutamate-1-semialdehyde 2,1-aminomutase
MNSGIKLWNKAKSIIPGGNQLLSKRAERFLPGLWPTYYKKAKGCAVWDLDNNKYFDFAQMGVGACTLGYADADVDRAVTDAIRNGSMCSLNSFEEVELAEKLIGLHPWSEMVRFARTGGEACAIAVRIARAAAGKDKIAFCGYHGWHDWYISSNIGNSRNLDNQLLPGLDSKGVPRALGETAFPFNYNQIDELEDIVAKHPNQIGVIIMEPERGTEPENDFLNKVRQIASKIGAVLIFDEVTSGFRMNLGGIHLRYLVNPDIAVFAKALGNGFPIAAIIGRREVMDVAQESFISSTMWTERIGFVAALSTINKMEQENVQQKLIYYGEKINEGWKRIAERNNLDIHISGIPPLTHIAFKVPQAVEAQTYYAQEMLVRGYLLGASVYTTYAYSDEIIDKFISDSDEVFNKLKSASEEGNIKKYLKGETIHTGFKRLA